MRRSASAHSAAASRMRGCESARRSCPRRIRLTGLLGFQVLNIWSSARSASNASSTAMATCVVRACGPRTCTLTGRPMMCATNACRGTSDGAEPGAVRGFPASGPPAVRGTATDENTDCCSCVTGSPGRWPIAVIGCSRRW